MLNQVAAWKADTSYDLVHHEQFGVASYLDGRLPSTALVQNVESQIYRRGAGSGTILGRVWAGIEGRKLTKREPGLLSRFDEVFVLSELDRAELREAGVTHVSVVPMPAPAAAPARAMPSGRTILTMGSMSWFGVADGLAWFHDLALPAIRAQVPGVQWHLIGPGAPARIRAYARENDVTLHGYVRDVAPFIKDARVAVIPLHVAGGIRMKLLELMAFGVPTVATTVGAEGIGFRDGQGAFRCDDPETFAQATIDLLADDEIWQSTVDAGRAFLGRARTAGDLQVAIDEGIERAIARHAKNGSRR
jgi:glycosyltransferase involved in cell wall biosynthesis